MIRLVFLTSVLILALALPPAEADGPCGSEDQCSIKYICYSHSGPYVSDHPCSATGLAEHITDLRSN